MANKVFIDIMNSDKHDAGTKARNDVAKILNSIGFEQTVLLNRNHSSFMRVCDALKAIIMLPHGLEDGDIVVLQYPYTESLMSIFISTVKRVKKRTDIKFVILIHDIRFLRENIGDEKLKKREVFFLNCADDVIVHNSTMEMKLEETGVSTKMHSIELFDYLYTGKKSKVVHGQKKTVIFAGNLDVQKSGFLYTYKGDGSVEFNLYGSNRSELPEYFHYKGSFSPDNLIMEMEGNYGLVWDGPSAVTCEGVYGNYLKYNNPHKLSLYVAAGVPVIVWSESAQAAFVKEMNIGIAVSSLEELKSLPCPDSLEYKEMLESVNSLRSSLCSGEMLKSVMRRIERGV